MRSELTDICVNLAGSSFRNDLNDVVDRAVAAGVSRMLVTASHLPEARECIDLCERFPAHLWATAGVHPHHASEWDQASSELLRELAAAQKVVAIGECGLDFNRNYSTAAEQRKAFYAQLEIARELQLPVLLHERDAHADFIAMVTEFIDELKGAVLHCFTSDRAALESCLEAGLSIGITGWVCDERRGQELAELVPHIPDDHLMIETDAPYLLPRDLNPRPKSRRNEPAFLAHINERMAQLKSTDPQSLAEITTRNAINLFQLT